MKDINTGIEGSLLKEISEIEALLSLQYNNEANERQRIETYLEKLNSIPEKIKYLRIEKKKYLCSKSFKTMTVSGIISKTIPGAELFLDKWISDKIGNLELEITDIQSDGMDFIKPEKKERFIEIEGKFSKEVENWKNPVMGHKTECAAFCEILYKREYFDKSKIKKLMETNQFAKARYGYDVYSMLKQGKEIERKHYHWKFNSRF